MLAGMKTLLLSLLMLAGPAFASETVEGLKKDYASFKEDMNAKLAEMDRKIERLKAESAREGKSAKEQAVTDLQAAREKLRRELDKTREAGAEGWTKFKRGFARSVDNLNRKIQKALKE